MWAIKKILTEANYLDELFHRNCPALRIFFLNNLWHLQQQQQQQQQQPINRVINTYGQKNTGQGKYSNKYIKIEHNWKV